MHVGRNFTVMESLVWTRRDIFKYLFLASLVVLVYDILNFRWIGMPWFPMALIGTAVAFMIGFKNNASYDRLWEARMIYGAIVNTSRTWGIMVRDFITRTHATQSLTDEQLKKVHQRIIYRHMGWLTAMRHQLRQPRDWETMYQKPNIEFKKHYKVPEEHENLENELKKFLSPADLNYIISKKNRATQILSLQSKDLKELLGLGLIEDFRHMELENKLGDFFSQQGKCERIKNFPYPRQFATLNMYFVWIFIFLLPFGMVGEFSKLGENFSWLTVPFSALVSWIFHTLEKIGEATENPFQGGPNDIPITSLSRTIEIDLREMLDETNVPDPIVAENNILM